MTGRPASGVLAATLAAAALAGCGGGSGRHAPSTTTGPATAPSGQQLFQTVGCASCHTLAAAGAHGQVGPNLDALKPSQATVVGQVTHGGGAMPAFRDTLDAAQIRSVARYVAQTAGR